MPGNYPLLDLQQLNTSLIDRRRIAQRVVATVVSHYPGRGDDGSDEYMCDAGAIAMSKDSGPISGYGEVIGKPWKLGRISQEHGTLTRETSGEKVALKDEGLEIGSTVQVGLFLRWMFSCYRSLLTDGACRLWASTPA